MIIQKNTVIFQPIQYLVAWVKNLNLELVKVEFYYSAPDDATRNFSLLFRSDKILYFKYKILIRFWAV